MTSEPLIMPPEFISWTSNMLLLCWLLRPFMVLGSIPILILSGVALSHFQHDAEVSTAILIFAFLYFCLAYFIFNFVPRKYRRQLLDRIDGFKANDFTATVEFFSVMQNRYVGLDTSKNQALLVDLSLSSDILIPFSHIDRWELTYSKPYSNIKIYSQVSAYREFGVRVKRIDAGPLESDLIRVLPTVASRTFHPS
uniref:Transmembrane protein n=1 Tax=Pseudomonas graminis TaxID=158627 RepID=A0A7C2AI35_9PSED